MRSCGAQQSQAGDTYSSSAPACRAVRLKADVAELARVANAVPFRDRLRLAPAQRADRRGRERNAFEGANSRRRFRRVAERARIELDRLLELRVHRAAFSRDHVLAGALEAGGEYAWRVRGEEHMWTPDAIAKLQHASRAGSYSTYKEYAQIIDDSRTAT